MLELRGEKDAYHARVSFFLEREGVSYLILESDLIGFFRRRRMIWIGWKRPRKLRRGGKGIYASLIILSSEYLRRESLNTRRLILILFIDSLIIFSYI